MITLFVDQKKPYTRLYKTPTYQLPTGDPYHWDSGNQALLYTIDKSDSFEIKNISEYNKEINCYYLISLRSCYDILYINFWQHIPKESRNIILKNKIPILLFFPLETVSFIRKEEWLEFLQKRNNAGFLNWPTILLSLSTFNDGHGNALTAIEPNHNLKYIQSVLFLLFYNQVNPQTQSTPIENSSGFICKFEDHKKENKKYNFLCLNNNIRTNRTWLLWMLYQEKNLWNNNLISARQDPRAVSVGTLHYMLQEQMRVDEPYVGHVDNSYRFFRILLQDGTSKRDDLLFLKNKPNLIKSIKELEKKKIDKNISNVLDYFKIKYDFDVISDLTYFIAELMESVDNGQYYPTRMIDKRGGPSLNSEWDKAWYEQSWFSVVTETHCYNPSIYHETPMITEKIIKTIINHHPFVVFGHSGSHNILKNLGFKTFEQSFLKLPEDCVEGNINFFDRLRNLIKGLKDFQSLSNDEIFKRYRLIEKDTVFNYKHLTETDWVAVQHDKFKNTYDFPI